MSNPIDLAPLETLHAAAGLSPINYSAYVSAVYRAFPSLVVELKALREESRWRKQGEQEDIDDTATRMRMLRDALGTRDAHGDIEGIERLVWDRDALRARVAELERKGGE